MATKNTNVKKVAGKQGETNAVAISVVALTESFSRAGRTFTRAEQIIEFGDLTDEQVDALVNEPMLHVTFIAEKAD